MNEKLNNYRMPAEWETQKSAWIAWPYNKSDWPGLYHFIPKVILEIISKISNHQKVNLIINEKDKIEIKPSLIQPVTEIKSLGKFKIKISLHSEVDAEIFINVQSADTIQ